MIDDSLPGGAPLEEEGGEAAPEAEPAAEAADEGGRRNLFETIS